MTDEDKKSALLDSATGTISGEKLTLKDDSSLSVANGSWTANNSVDISKGTSNGGKIEVGTAKHGAAILKFAAGSKLSATSGTISIGMDSNGPIYAELDLSNLSKDDVTFSKAEITVTKNGSLVLSEGAAQSLVSNLIATDGTKLQIQSGAMTTVNGNITLKPGQLASGSATVQAIGLSGDGSTLKADSITIAEEVAAQTATALNVGAGTLETGTLTLTSFNTGTNKQNNFSLDSGNFIVLNNLSSDDGAKLDLTFTKAETKVQLGKVIPVQTGSSIYKLDPEASASGNTVGYNIIMAAGSTLDVKSGEWRGQDLTINSGSATIGSGMTGEDGNKIAATFNGNKLTIGTDVTTGKGLIINEGGEANFSEFYQSTATTDSANSVTATIKGKMTVKGKYVAYEPEVKAENGNTPKAEVPESFGLSIGGNINIDGSNAVLSIGKDALSTAIVGFSGAGKDTVIQYKEPGKPSGAAVDLVTGHVTFANFGTLELDLSHLNNNSFTVDQLAAVRKEFTGDGSTPISGGFIHLVGGALTDSGLSGDQISVENLSKFNDFKDIKVDNLMNAQVTGVTNSNVISQNVGSLMAKDDTETAAHIGQATLNNARPLISGGEAHFAVNTAGKDLNLNVQDGGYLHLNNGGVAGKVSLKKASSGNTQLLVSGGQAQTVIEQVSGDSSTRMELVSGKTTVNKDLVVGALDTAVGADLVVNGSKSVNGLTLNSANSVSTLKGNVEAGKVSFAGETVFAGNNNSFLLMNASGKDSGLTFKNGTTTVSSMLGIDVSKAVDNGVEVLDNAVLNVDGAIKLGAQSYLGVGSEHEYAADGKTVVESGSTGYLYAKMVDLNGGIMGVDPEYGMKTSVAAVGAFGAGTFNLLNAADAGTVSGDIVVSQNAALGVGQSVNLDTVKNFVAQYQDDNGSLSKDGVANVMYIDGKIMHKSGRIILDGQNRLDDSVAVLREGSTAFAYGYDADSNKSVSGDELADLYIGNGSILALGNGAVNGAIEFADATAQIYAPASADSKNAQQGKIVLAGEDFLKSRNITLFTAGAKAGTVGKPETAVPGSAKNVTVLGETGKDDIRVESLNGLMYFTLEAGKALEEKGYNLKLDTKRVDTAFTAASAPMRDFLIGYTAQDKNWSAVAYGEAGAVSETLLGNVAGAMVTAANGTVEYAADATEEFKQANPLSNFVAVNTGTAEAPQYVAYEKAYNGFLEDVVRNTNGADADRVGRMAAFGGAAQAALTATGTTSDAVSGRFGMGQSASALTYADNGQGTGMWVTPVYRSSDSDGFAAEGLEFGSDVSLFGVALGGDYSLGNGMRVGAMLNIGSGDADGQGAGQGVSNDFNYFGGAMYAGFSMDALSVVADLSYTTVDSDIETDTVSGKVSTSFDTTALSAGVTGQYTMDFAGVQVAPHAGLRFTRLDMDNFEAVGFDGGSAASVENSTANVFSIPVGVTIAKEYAGEQWTVKPSFDLTLTGNFGDDTLDSTVNWTDVTNWSVATKSEFVDSFTYGAAMGVAAKSGNLGVGVGLNYTGSSNIKEFGASANVRYVF